MALFDRKLKTLSLRRKKHYLARNTRNFLPGIKYSIYRLVKSYYLLDVGLPNVNDSVCQKVVDFDKKNRCLLSENKGHYSWKIERHHQPKSQQHRLSRIEFHRKIFSWLLLITFFQLTLHLSSYSDAEEVIHNFNLTGQHYIKMSRPSYRWC